MAVQLVAWVCCVLASRLLGGLVVPAAAALAGQSSPYYLLAQAIYKLRWSCDAKRWTFAGVLRIVIDVLQLAFVDACNKFRRRRQEQEGLHECNEQRMSAAGVPSEILPVTVVGGSA